MEAELDPQTAAAAEWAAAEKVWADMEAELDAQGAVAAAMSPASGEAAQRGLGKANDRKRKRERNSPIVGSSHRPKAAQRKPATLMKGTLPSVDISNGLDSVAETEIKRQYQDNGLVMIKLLDQVGCFPLFSPVAGSRTQPDYCRGLVVTATYSPRVTS